MKTRIPVRTIDPIEVKKLTETGYVIDLIDVRTPAEFRGVHAAGSVNLPLDDLDVKELMKNRADDGEPVYFICRSDSRGKKACEAMIAAGCTNVVNVAGGIVAWEDLGLAVRRGKQTISLERQIRIAAGLLVVVGAALTVLHPVWIALPIVIGSGLVFAGVTDSCGMAMMLSKMPWNQVG